MIVGMTYPEEVPAPIPHWKEELKRQERSILWLARQTGAHRNTVYRYAWGLRHAPPSWLIAASRALGMRTE